MRARYVSGSRALPQTSRWGPSAQKSPRRAAAGPSGIDGSWSSSGLPGSSGASPSIRLSISGMEKPVTPMSKSRSISSRPLSSSASSSCGVPAYVLFALLAHKLEDFARIDLIGRCLGDSGRNPSCYPRIEAMNHHGLEIRDDLTEFRPGLPQVEIWLAADDRFVER